MQEEYKRADEEETLKKEEKRRHKSGIIGVILTSAIILSIILAIVSITLNSKKKFNIKATSSGVGLIKVRGVISFSDSRYSSFGIAMPSIVEKLKNDFEFFVNDPNTLAIVISINSPGGSLTACESTLKDLKILKEKTNKPVIISFQEIAASGGYYLAMIGDEIFANESTITGSIGVIVPLMDVSQLLDKYGVNMYSITSGKNKDALSPFKAATQEELNYWQTMVSDMFGLFTNVVIESRGDRLKGNRNDIFDGRVFMGQNAIKYGLIDKIGNLNEAISYAAELVDLDGENPHIILRKENKAGFLPLLFSSVDKTLSKKSSIYESMLNTDNIGIPMYLYIPGAKYE